MDSTAHSAYTANEYTGNDGLYPAFSVNGNGQPAFAFGCRTLN